MKIESFQDLIIWKKGMGITFGIYDATDKYPRYELYSLTDQTRRSGISVPSNIAEGYQRRSRREYVQFLYISFGSCAELRTQLLIAQHRKYLSEIECNRLIQQIDEEERLIASFIRSLEKKHIVDPRP